MKTLPFLLALLGTCAQLLAATNDWTTASPREEIRPQFERTETGGQSGHGTLTIRTDAREGLHGFWLKSFPVTAGQHYRFSVWRRAENVPTPRRSIVARLLWQNEKGNSVRLTEGYVTNYLRGFTANAEPEYPAEMATNAAGWVEMSATYQVPPGATQAKVELHSMWATNASVQWSDAMLQAIEAPKPRVVRLASVHYRPHGAKTPMANCQQFASLIAEAAQRKADLVVLGETLTYANTGLSYAQCAESIPGPSTEYFGKLAKEHNLYIVAGLIERDQHLLFNVAVLIGPDGQLVGKFRKVCLPRSEIEGGLSPGSDYPVFNTRFGKLGMMICYDGFFPEVARELSNRGAEVIAWPVWGCNPELARARASENHVYVVSSTYEDITHDWMLTAVYGRDGDVIANAKQWGTVCMAEVDLNQRTIWPVLGDFKAQIPSHRPVVKGE
jgi:predicted amidohydrolase